MSFKIFYYTFNLVKWGFENLFLNIMFLNEIFIYEINYYLGQRKISEFVLLYGQVYDLLVY